MPTTKSTMKHAKNGKNQQIMDSFTLKTIPSLDTCVLAALELFSNNVPKALKVTYKRPLVVGSGNAAATGKILFETKDAIFADESTVETKLKNINAIDGVVLISASGAKHAPLIVKLALKYKKHVTLITNTHNSLAQQVLETVKDTKYSIHVYPKNREPYTYNTSTYMGPILAYTKEDPKKILRFIKQRINKLTLPHFRDYKRYYLIVPEEFEGIIRLLNVKFIELFGRNIARDIETFEYVKHATTVVPAKNELFISFGKKYKDLGENHLYIPLPKHCNYAAMMAISYYLIGKIQTDQPQWFKRNIHSYTQKVSKIFGHKILAIVE